MLSSPRFFIISLCVLAVGVSISLSRSNRSDSSKVKSTEAYWAETGLGPAALEDLLQDQTCGSSERYFLACANSILTVANRFNMSLNTAGKLVPVQEALSADMSTEKKQLEPWKEFFSAQTDKAVKISFLKAWQELSKRFISDEQKSMMVGLGLNGFISVFRDPHTYLMPVSQFQEVISKADNRSASLGITLGRSQGNYVIRKVTEGSAAKSAGVEKGDVIVSINGQRTPGLLQARVSELLKGEVGDLTTLIVTRDGERLKFKLRRKEITVATVSTRVIEGIKPVAVVGINKFAKGACDKVKESLSIVKKSHVRGLLLDLRDNPGGQMEEAACIASLFVGPEQKIFEVRYLDPSKKREDYFGGEEKMFDLPMAVLVNGSSASAAEIVAGALRDLNRAVLVGERTFGKGSFQEGEYWSQNKKIALFETKGFYYLPSGRSPQMKGLQPDVVVNFDNILVMREADQFMNPLRAPERQVRAAGPLYSSNDCLDLDEGGLSDDVQLSKAQQVLFCSGSVARAGL
ncbi:S41 family peptidase [Bdellovibrio sp. 22V]|uniref:S41 family peptidase n=1 Tax=Bdellovibrio sp. 22V TaxID=3044166 RepID=UPI002543D115|nr:S41 family peptidase [Bdellovibrio sp. 22V]WII72514.1 S41 family peptidase [Bdellovibrio sp. 22V]